MHFPLYVFLSETSLGAFTASLIVGLFAAFFWTALADRYGQRDRLVRVETIAASSHGPWDRAFHLFIYSLAVIASIMWALLAVIALIAWLVALARFGLTCNTLAWVSAQPWFIAPTVLTGLFLYGLRRDHPLRFGLAEALLSLAAMWIVISSQMEYVTRILSLLGCLCVFVGAASSIDKGLSDRRISLRSICTHFVVALLDELFPPSRRSSSTSILTLRVVSAGTSGKAAMRMTGRRNEDSD